MKIVAVVVVALALLVAPAWSRDVAPTMTEVRDALAERINADFEAAKETALKFRESGLASTRAACETYTSACGCATESACVWVVGVKATVSTTTANAQADVQLGGFCVDGTPAAGPSSSFGEVTSLIPQCWWPKTAASATSAHSCSENCFYTQELTFGSIYIRAEMELSPNLRLSSQADAANLMGSFGFKAFMMYSTSSSSGLLGSPSLPIFTGTAYMQAGAGGATQNGVAGVSGAAFFVMLDSWFVYDTTAHPNGFTPPASGDTTTYNAIGSVTLSKSQVTATGNSATVNKWTLTSSSTSPAIQITYDCYFGKDDFQLLSGGTTYLPYDAKCDFSASGFTLGANEALGLRMVVASASADLTVDSSSASSSSEIQIGAGAIAFAPKATNVATSTDTDVKVTSASCASALTGQSWASDSDFIDTMAGPVGAPKFACTYASFASGVNNLKWDPETKIDKAKADATIASKSSAASLTASPVLALFVAIAVFIATFA